MKIRFHNFWLNKSEYFPFFQVTTGRDESTANGATERFVDFALFGFYISFTFKKIV